MSSLPSLAEVTVSLDQFTDFQVWKSQQLPALDDVTSEYQVAQACRNHYGHCCEFRPLPWLKMRYVDGWLWRTDPARALCLQQDVLGMDDQAIYELATR